MLFILSGWKNKEDFVQKKKVTLVRESMLNILRNIVPLSHLVIACDWVFHNLKKKKKGQISNLVYIV